MNRLSEHLRDMACGKRSRHSADAEDAMVTAAAELERFDKVESDYNRIVGLVIAAHMAGRAALKAVEEICPFVAEE